jgi:hypothetical protein
MPSGDVAVAVGARCVAEIDTASCNWFSARPVRRRLATAMVGGFDGQINERGCLRENVSEDCGVGFSYKTWSVTGFPAEPSGDRAGKPATR